MRFYFNDDMIDRALLCTIPPQDVSVAVEVAEIAPFQVAFGHSA